jgi:hypothetical protein
MGGVLPVAVIGIIAGFLAFREDYDDGLIGRLSFSVIVMMAFIFCMGPITGHYSYAMPLEITVLLYAIAVFMLRHAWRFLQFKKKGKYAWVEE